MRDRSYLTLERKTGLPAPGWQVRAAVAIGREWLNALVHRGMATMPYPVPTGTPAARNAAILDFVQEGKVEQAVDLLDEFVREEIAYMNRNLSAPLRADDIHDLWMLAKGEVPSAK